MRSLARFVVAHRWWVLVAWLLLAAVGGYAAPRAVDALSFDFSLPGRPGSEANDEILRSIGSGGPNPPILLVAGDGTAAVPDGLAQQLSAAVGQAVDGRVASWADQADLLSADGTVGVLVVHPAPVPGPDPYAAALPALTEIAAGVSEQAGVPVVVTGDAALVTEDSGGGDSGSGGGPSVLVETILGGGAALLILVLVFGSALALTPLIIAAGSILTTFLIVWGLTGITEISFIVQFLLALIGLGVAIDYALLVVTRWREEKLGGADTPTAIGTALATAGRSVLFSGITVAVSLAALIVLPVPFLRSVGFTGLLIPVVSVLASLTLLPALLSVAGERLMWPRRPGSGKNAGRTGGTTVSRLWERIGGLVVRRRWIAIAGATLILLALALPLTGLRLGTSSASALLGKGGDPAAGVERLDESGLGVGLLHPVEVLTYDRDAVVTAVEGVDGVGGVVAPAEWAAEDGPAVVDVWTVADTSGAAGADAAAAVRAAAEGTGAQVGGLPAQDADFLSAVYGNAGWVALAIVAVTFLLLARALRSIWLPIKALVLNVLSLAAAYGITVLIWQDGLGTELLFGEQPADAITTWVPVAVFAFLFGLSMDYEVFLLSRIREEYDAGHDTAEATVRGLARTGRLVTSAALILFFAFVSLSTVPTVDVKILATGLALGIVIDATIVRGVLAPALVAAFGPLNWTCPRWLAGRTPLRH